MLILKNLIFNAFVFFIVQLPLSFIGQANIYSKAFANPLPNNFLSLKEKRLAEPDRKSSPFSKGDRVSGFFLVQFTGKKIQFVSSIGKSKLEDVFIIGNKSQGDLENQLQEVIWAELQITKEDRDFREGSTNFEYGANLLERQPIFKFNPSEALLASLKVGEMVTIVGEVVNIKPKPNLSSSSRDQFNGQYQLKVRYGNNIINLSLDRYKAEVQNIHSHFKENEDLYDKPIYNGDVIKFSGMIDTNGDIEVPAAHELVLMLPGLEKMQFLEGHLDWFDKTANSAKTYLTLKDYTKARCEFARLTQFPLSESQISVVNSLRNSFPEKEKPLSFETRLALVKANAKYSVVFEAFNETQLIHFLKRWKINQETSGFGEESLIFRMLMEANMLQKPEIQQLIVEAVAYNLKQSENKNNKAQEYLLLKKLVAIYRYGIDFTNEAVIKQYFERDLELVAYAKNNEDFIRSLIFSLDIVVKEHCHTNKWLLLMLLRKESLLPFVSEYTSRTNLITKYKNCSKVSI